VCAVIDLDAVVMHPAVAYTLTARTISPRVTGMRMSRPQPFLEAAAHAMGIDRLRVIDSGIDPVWGQPGQRDDGSNVLAVSRRVAISHERNSETNARLEDAGIRVIRVPSSELGSVRGGPRCMTCPVSREPAALPAHLMAEPGLRLAARRHYPAVAADVSVPDSRPASEPGPVEIPPVPAPPVPAPPVPVSTAAAANGAATDREQAELASASLEPAALPPARTASRAPAEPEQAQRRRDCCEDQGDQRQPDKGLDDRHGHEHDHDRGTDHYQRAKHVSTVRPGCAARLSRPARGPVTAR